MQQILTIMVSKNKLILLLGFIAIATSAWGATADNAAMRKAAMRALKSAGEVELVANYQSIAAYNSTNGGFAIVSRDEHAPRVLAYSPSGSLDMSSRNPGFNWWLNAVNKSRLKDTPKPDPARFAPSVAPLITTKWGQNEPFRYMCPFMEYNPDLTQYGIYIPDSTHNAVGCGPAAMAQIMNYYRHPMRGTDSAQVVVKYDQANVTLSVDFESATYEWDKMIDDYNGEYTRENGEAVALLCYHAAVAAKTNWNGLGGSTYDEDILNAFKNHFNYNDSARLLNRPLYNDEEWMEMVYTMLNAGHPVLYSGKDINFEVGILVGHNFIIDGYDENGLVHVNWGWQGREDGYFDIATLTVGKLSFDDWQGMYLDLYPKRESIIGDVNSDGVVNSADVTAIYRYILNGDTSHESTSDVNNDGHINSSDVTMLYNILLGK